MLTRVRSWLFRCRPRPFVAITMAAAAFVVVRGVALAVGLGQEEPPPLTEGGFSLLSTLAQLFVVLGPYFTQRITEWLRTTFPSWEEMDGRIASMNVSIVVFIVAILGGLATHPPIDLPAVPTSGSLADYGTYGIAILTVGIVVLRYIIDGARQLHEAWKAKTGQG